MSDKAGQDLACMNHFPLAHLNRANDCGVQWLDDDRRGT